MYKKLLGSMRHCNVNYMSSISGDMISVYCVRHITMLYIAFIIIISEPTLSCISVLGTVAHFVNQVDLCLKMFVCFISEVSGQVFFTHFLVNGKKGPQIKPPTFY